MPDRPVDALAKSQLRRALPDPRRRKLIRQLAELSQEDVGQAVGELLEPPRLISGAVVSRWENGQRDPRQPYRDAYARLLSQLAAAVQETV